MSAQQQGQLPVLYSFRRCPYAIRARLGLAYAGIQLELREVDLNSLPAVLIELVPDNRSVPVLQLPGGEVIDESWDVLLWAVRQNDPDGWLGEQNAHLAAAEHWIEMNDYSFKADLDHYKYAVRYPAHPQVYYREQACEFIQDLEDQLSQARYLLGDSLSVADIGILPFVRQFAGVDEDWFARSPYPQVRAWLGKFLNSRLFAAVMQKYPLWTPAAEPQIWG